MICTQFGWNRPAGSGQEDLKKKISVFLLFCYYLPLGEVIALHALQGFIWAILNAQHLRVICVKSG
jgi:hypothetical protein